MLRNLVKEVQTGIVHAETEKGQPVCHEVTGPRTVTSSSVGDDSEITCDGCRRRLPGRDGP
jgi:hypothetical protein